MSTTHRPVTHPAHVELDRLQGASIAPRTAVVLAVLAARLDRRGRVAIALDELTAETGLDALDIEIGLAVALGRGVLRNTQLRELPGGEIVLVALFAPVGGPK